MGQAGAGAHCTPLHQGCQNKSVVQSFDAILPRAPLSGAQSCVRDARPARALPPLPAQPVGPAQACARVKDGDMSVRAFQTGWAAQKGGKDCKSRTSENPLQAGRCALAGSEAGSGMLPCVEIME